MATSNKKLLQAVEHRGIGPRKLTKATCQKYNYGFSTYMGQEVQVASFEVDGEVVAQKLRLSEPLASGKFLVLGDSERIGLWGKERVRPDGRMLVITEGELDCLAVSQVFEHKYPVVSVPQGANTAHKYIKKDLQWISNYDKVVLCFDEDEAGRKAVEKCKGLFEPGKLRIARLPLKDPCEMLKAGKSSELYRAIWEAERYVPSELVHGDELWDGAESDDEEKAGVYPWDSLNKMTDGCRYSELIMLVAGSGVGKSTLCHEIAASRLAQGENVCYIPLEAKPKRTLRGVAQAYAGVPILTEFSPKMVPHLRQVREEIGDKLWIFDGWGYSEVDDLFGMMRYAAKGLECRTIVLDHVSMVISGMDTDNERRAIDTLMHRLRAFVEETNVLLFCVSHLKRPEGKGHEEGGRVSLSQLRGSASLAQQSDLCIGMERDQQADEEEERDVSTLRILKNRWNGRTGPAGHLKYNHQTGKLESWESAEALFDPSEDEFK